MISSALRSSPRAASVAMSALFSTTTIPPLHTRQRIIMSQCSCLNSTSGRRREPARLIYLWGVADFRNGSFASIFARLGCVRLSGNIGSAARDVAGVRVGVAQSCRVAFRNQCAANSRTINERLSGQYCRARSCVALFAEHWRHGASVPLRPESMLVKLLANLLRPATPRAAATRNRIFRARDFHKLKGRSE